MTEPYSFTVEAKETVRGSTLSPLAVLKIAESPPSNTAATVDSTMGTRLSFKARQRGLDGASGSTHILAHSSPNGADIALSFSSNCHPTEASIQIPA